MTVYFFGVEGQATNETELTNLLGGKGANLVEMSKIGVPVPPGFTITTKVCNAYRASSDKKTFMSGLMETYVMPAMSLLEKQFGYMPMVSVRSGARVSMPGMMDTILNVGAMSLPADEWIGRVGEKTFLDCRRRFLQMYGEVVMEIPADRFDILLCGVKDMVGAKTDQDLSVSALNKVIHQYRKLVSMVNDGWDETLYGQLRASIEAVFKSWDSERAVHYRQMHGYPEDWGTAVNVQAMVFGNRNDQSCSGVLFTRNPSTGENEAVGEFLVNAQGEDVVAGVRTPASLKELSEWDEDILLELSDVVDTLEKHYRDMQDIEFTVEDGKLYILQTRNGKRTAVAAFKIALDLFNEGMISKEEMASRLSGKMYEALGATSIAPGFNKIPNAIGIPAGGQVVVGKVALSSGIAVKMAAAGAPVILVSEETTPNDIKGMDASVGILTRTGGATSHAAVVARGLDKVCVVGCTHLTFGYGDVSIDGVKVSEGDIISINGATGEVWLEEIPLVDGGVNPNAEAVLGLLRGECNSAPITTSPVPGVDVVSYVVGSDGLLSYDDMDSIKDLTEAHKNVVLDLNDPADNLLEEDEFFFSTFDSELLGIDGKLARLKVNMKFLLGAEVEVRKKLILILPEWAAGLGVQVPAGVKVIGPVSTVADLMAGGYFSISDDFIEKVIGGKETFDMLMAIAKDKGAEFKQAPKVVIKEMEAYELLG